MAFFNHTSSSPYLDGGGGDFNIVSPSDAPNQLTDDGGDSFFTLGETINNGPGPIGTYAGTLTVGPDTFIAVFNGTFHFLFSPDNIATATFPASFNTSSLVTTPLLACFVAGTKIATPTGETAVESLAIGDLVRVANGGAVPVKWIGRQSVTPVISGPNCAPVCIRAAALGSNLPHSDLTVTGDHGMITDDMVINASALINGTTIDWVPLSELPTSFTVYHIETEAHDVILANGAPSETFVDIPGRMAFDNYAEYLDLYGAERIIPEMTRPRITSRRLLPDAIKARLGIVNDEAELWGSVA